MSGEVHSHFRAAFAGEKVLSLARINDLARKFHLAPKAIMLEALACDVWPERFARNKNVLSAADMRRLLSLRVFIAGVGGLGGHVANQLARMGVGAMRLCDPDIFEETNLNRQLFCAENTLGMPKVAVASASLRELASHLEIEELKTAATAENLPSLLQGVDVVMDCLDSVAGKKMLEKAAASAGLPYIHGSVLEMEGFCYLDNPGLARLESLYPGDENDRETPHTLACLVSGIASLMCSLLVEGLVKGNFKNSPLLHLDQSSCELNHFQSA